MNRATHIVLLISIIGLGFLSNSCMDRSLKAKTEICYIDIPFGKTTEDFKANIIFDKNKSYHYIKLPHQGPETRVSIYDSTYLDELINQFEKNKEYKPKALANGHFENSQEVILNISSLNSGKYYIDYLSGHFGGIFTIIITNSTE